MECAPSPCSSWLVHFRYRRKAAWTPSRQRYAERSDPILRYLHILRAVPRSEVGHQQQHTTRPLHGSTHNILADHKRVFQSIRCIIRWIEIVECGYDCGKDSVYSSNDEEGPRCEEDIERWMDALADSRLPTV